MKTTKLVAIAAAAALGLSGCSLVSGSDGPKGSSTESDKKQADRMKAAAQATAPQPQHVLAKHDGTLDQQPITAKITALIRDGSTVTLSYTLTNDSTDNISGFAQLEQSQLVSNADKGEADTLTLVDGTQKKKYLVARDAQGNCVCSVPGTDNLDAGETMGLSATFAAPPTSIGHITVQIPGFEPFYSIPIK
ncbi:MAG TPA: hypothetical protein VGL93_04530 [Streptosporangiaceae bacterium]|jgi:hypothetical protein